MSDILDDLRFWSQAIEDNRRTIICNPEWESRIKTMVAAQGMDDTFKVQPDRHCPVDQIFLVDENAAEAYRRQSLQPWPSRVRPVREGDQP